jgi:hypothetical protein
VEILDLRHFSSADLRPLLDDETAVWSRLLHWDYRSSAEMILRYIDAKILPGYAAPSSYTRGIKESSEISSLQTVRALRMPMKSKLDFFDM